MKVVIFDFDGVLVDTFDFARRINNEIRNVSLSEDDYRALFLGNFYASAGQDPAEKITEPTPFFTAYTAELLKTSPIVGIREVLVSLQQSGCHMVIVSSSLDSAISDFLEKEKLSGYFSGIYGASVSKSKVYKLRKVLEDYSVRSEEVVFVTDTLGDIREAGEVGIASIAVTWGYHSPQTLAEGQPSAIVDAPAALLTVIQ
jgi:phosphoglycolate phosphatase